MEFYNKRFLVLTLIPIMMVFILFFTLLLFLPNGSSMPPKQSSVPPKVETELSIPTLFSGYECVCRENLDFNSRCLRNIKLYSSKHYTVYCLGSRKKEDNITIYDISSGQSKLFYNYQDLQKIFTFLDECLTSGEPCSEFEKQRIHEEPNSIICRYYVNIYDKMTLCISYDNYISGGFANSTILSRSDVINLYHVTRDWFQRL